MSDDDEQTPDPESDELQPGRIRRTPAFEAFGSQQQTELNAKLARLQAFAGDAGKAHRAKFAPLAKNPGLPTSISELLGTDKPFDIPDPKLMPAYRAAAAAEDTARTVEILVNATLKAADDADRRDRDLEERNKKVDRRENWVLGSTIVGVVLAGIAAFGPVDLPALLEWVSGLFQ